MGVANREALILGYVSPFSSVFSVFFRNFFHQDANSRFDGGETAGTGPGAGVLRGSGRTMGCGDVVVPAPPVAIIRLQAQCALQPEQAEEERFFSAVGLQRRRLQLWMMPLLTGETGRRRGVKSERENGRPGLFVDVQQRSGKMSEPNR